MAYRFFIPILLLVLAPGLAEAKPYSAIACLVANLTQIFHDKNTSFTIPRAEDPTQYFTRLRQLFDASVERDKALSTAEKKGRVEPNQPFLLLKMISGYRISDRFHWPNYITSPPHDHKFTVTKSGLLVDSRGKPLHGKFNFVMDPNGDFYFGPLFVKIVLRQFHSRLLNGAPVAAAGQITVENGRLIQLDDRSGHYFPPWQFLFQAITRLNSLHADLRETKVLFSAPPK